MTGEGDICSPDIELLGLAKACCVKPRKDLPGYTEQGLHTHTHTHTVQTYIHTHMNTHMDTCEHTDVHTRALTHTNAAVTHMQMQAHMNMHPYRRTLPCARTYIRFVFFFIHK